MLSDEEEGKGCGGDNFLRGRIGLKHDAWADDDDGPVELVAAADVEESVVQHLLAFFGHCARQVSAKLPVAL